MLRRALLVPIVAILSACATSTPINGPDGSVMHLVECPGMMVPLGECFKEAAALCPKGYTLEKQDTGTAGINKSIVVKCK